MFIRYTLLLVVMFASMSVFAASWPDVPLPSGMRTAVVDRHIVYNGLNMQAMVFRSQEKPADIVAFYRKSWGKKIVVNDFIGAKLIGHLQGDYYITIQVSSFAGGSRGKIGIINIKSVPRHFTLGNGLPKPMGSKVFNDIRYPDDPIPVRTVAMSNTLSPRQNASYFRERLAGEGWKPVEGNGCQDIDSCVLRYTRGDSKLSLVAMRDEHGHSEVVINVQGPKG